MAHLVLLVIQVLAFLIGLVQGLRYFHDKPFSHSFPWLALAIVLGRISDLF